MPTSKMEGKKRLILLTLFFAALTGQVQAQNGGCNKRLNSTPAKWESLRVAAVQFPVTGSPTLADFIKKTTKFVEDAANRGANLIVFPELFVLDLIHDGSNQVAEQLRSLAQTSSPEIMTRISGLASQYNLTILAGSMPREVEGHIYNTAVLAFPDGRRVLQDKVFLTPDEEDWGWTPGQVLKIINTPWGPTSIFICYDGEFPLLSQILADRFPEVILVPSMTEALAGFRRVRWSAQSRAIEHKAYVVHTGTIGRITNGWDNYGQASVLTPSEDGFPGVLGEGVANKSAVLIETLDLTRLRSARAAFGIYPARKQTERTIPIHVIEE